MFRVNKAFLLKIALVFITALLLPSAVEGADAKVVKCAEIETDCIQADTLKENSRYSFSSVVHTGLYSPFPSEVPAGQYSGITYMGGTSYAVVDDKLKGGGLLFFDILINNDGTISHVYANILEQTLSSMVTGLDNEGIAFVPSKALPSDTASLYAADFLSDSIDTLADSELLAYGTLFISSEGEQSISEYDLEGKPTGRKLEIPAELGKDKIVPNNGFEAFTYNHATGMFWAATERSLKADEPLSDEAEYSDISGRTLRLQGFTSDLKPSGQYIYVMDSPTKKRAAASAAKAYVHGVSAMVALDDGRLLVLEREVFVPTGGRFAMMLGSFTKNKIYMVRPPGELCREPLEKTLFTSFTTNAFNLANYEGMCLGPVLPGGWNTLVLVADSQGGQGGLTQEYIKVITFK